MTFHTGHRAIWLLRTGLTAVTAVAGVATHVLLYLLWKGLWWPWGIWLGAWAAGWWWYVPAFCRTLSGRFDGTAVRVHSGVIWRHHTLVPLSSLRTFEVWAPPLHRVFGCRTVILRFAGGSTWLPLLDAATAKALATLLEKQGEKC